MIKAMLVTSAGRSRPVAIVVATVDDTRTVDTVLQRMKNASNWRQEERERSAFQTELLDLSSHCVGC